MVPGGESRGNTAGFEAMWSGVKGLSGEGGQPMTSEKTSHGLSQTIRISQSAADPSHPDLRAPTMPAPTCASCQAARAALRRPRSGQALCGACFCAAFEAEVLHTVRAGRLLPPGAVVAVGASGGKDSTVLAHVLRALAPSLDITLHLVAVDEGISGYRDAALAAVRDQAASWGLPLTIVAYADLFGGWTMDAVASSTAGSGRSRSCCTFCGVLRRRALEEGARRVGATHIVTGHNADDMAETVLMNFLRGDAGRLARGGGLGSAGEGGALPRCRPLQLASQKEVVLYAHFRRLRYFSRECAFAPEAFRGHARQLLKRLEAARPSAVLDLVHSAERLALAPAARPPRPGACSRCGALASRALCQACALLDGLNRGRPRLAIGKGRRGLDERLGEAGPEDGALGNGGPGCTPAATAETKAGPAASPVPVGPGEDGDGAVAALGPV
ncbi:cytoplasmic tRNA 2-thiolation protein 1 isoform X2 [Dipodomys merriami]|uniref:cytoplasmic tRNA 2-thiolation protein 1 isoform X2 n=1 Tax=Dipodomys merriami TaxID=94247 RepID=UPI003855D73F